MARAQLGDEHYELAELLGLLASAWTVDGQADRAREAFRIAIPMLLRQDSRSESSATTQFSRQLRLRFILQHYLATLMPGATTGATLVPRAATGGTQTDIATAFRIAEHGRSGAVQRALFASAGRTAIDDPVLADLARREQDALNRIGTLNGMVINAGFHDAGTRQAMIDRIDSLKAARTQLMAKISGEFPAYEALINPRPPTLADVRRSLAPNEALIALFIGDERTYVGAVPKSGAVASAVVAAGRDELTDAVALLRGALEPNAAALDDIPPFDVATAYRLFDTLLAPVRAGWQDAESLLVVTNAPLSYLPLSLLPTAPVTLALAPAAEPRFSRYRSVPWLVRSHAVTVLPSVASLIALRTVVRRTVARRAVIGFGDPWFSPEQARQARRVPASSRVAPIMVRAALKTR